MSYLRLVDRQFRPLEGLIKYGVGSQHRHPLVEEMLVVIGGRAILRHPYLVHLKDLLADVGSNSHQQREVLARLRFRVEGQLEFHGPGPRAFLVWGEHAGLRAGNSDGSLEGIIVGVEHVKAGVRDPLGVW